MTLGPSIPTNDALDEREEAERDFADAELQRAKEECWCTRVGDEHDELCRRRRDGDR